MDLFAKVLVAFVALIHVYILYLEMFAWETRGRKAFKGALSDELFSATRVMAANQGLYNGFLASGLIWSLFISDPVWSSNVALFFLGCVTVAGIYGAMTIARKIFFIQSLPALLTILLILVL